MTAAVLAGGAIGTLAACGDDGPSNPDARRFDAPIGGPDGMPDATPAANYVGQLSILEATVWTPDGSGDFQTFGQGPSFRMAYTDPALTGAPIMEDMPGSPFGCKAFEYTPAQFAALAGVDLGTINITFTGGVNVPDCAFNPALGGYACAALNTASPGDNAVIGPGPQAGLHTYTDVDVTYQASAVGRYLVIGGATAAGNNGAFPIGAVAGANTLVYANPAAVDGANPGGQSITVAGVGPTPQVPDPGFIADDATMNVTFTSSNPQAFPNYSGALADFGNDFDPDAASLALLTGMPLTTDADLVFDCDAGAPCADSLSRVVNIQTTDAPLAGLSPFAMPPPVTKGMLIRCTSALGGGPEVTVPEAYADLLATSGATRIQTTMVSASLAAGTGLPNSKLVVLGGHSAVGFTTVPPPTLH